jgi:hypothetical protein
MIKEIKAKLRQIKRDKLGDVSRISLCEGCFDNIEKYAQVKEAIFQENEDTYIDEEKIDFENGKTWGLYCMLHDVLLSKGDRNPWQEGYRRFDADEDISETYVCNDCYNNLKRYVEVQKIHLEELIDDFADNSLADIEWESEEGEVAGLVEMLDDILIKKD